MSLVSMARSDDYGRVAFVAGRKVGPAVRRNRAKRLLREAWRSLPESIREEPCWRIWVARASCAGASLAEIRAEMGRLLEQRRAAP